MHAIQRMAGEVTAGFIDALIDAVRNAKIASDNTYLC
jgi:hypothetical protein